MMSPISSYLQATLLAPVVLSGLVHALPVPQAGSPSSSSPLPSGTSGSLRGPLSLGGYNGNPINPDDSADVTSYALAPGQTESADIGLYLDFSDIDEPQPIRGSLGSTDPGPANYLYEKLNPDSLAPPGTDSGSIPQAMWPMALSHNRLGIENAGWTRQQNINQLPAATEMAGVDMRLAPSAYRELHWHTANEWGFVINGSCRVQAVNTNGETFVDDLNEGDVWVFPSGVPHSIQAFDQGVEFLLIFDNGSFNEDATFLASEMFLRTPLDVLAKDLKVDISAFDNIPSDELYIFPGTPAPTNISEQNITGSAGVVPQNQSYSYHFSQQTPYSVPGGSVKILDSTTFPVATMFAAALVTVEPGAMREIHWHPQDEWNFFLAGTSARVSIFEAPDSAGTFDFTAGDVGYIPAVETHYIENTGTDTLVFIEMLKTTEFSDISMGQWLGLTPPQIVADTLHLSPATLATLPKVKQYIIDSGDVNNTQTNFTVSK